MDSTQTYLQCIEGPLEDSGRLPGYEGLLETLSNVNDPNEYKDVSSWVNKVTGPPTYDPKRFDQSDVDRRLEHIGSYEQF